MKVQHDQAKAIFLSAVEIAAVEERRAFVAARCSGAAVRAEVEELLAHHEGLGSFLQDSPLGLTGDFGASATTDAAEGPGTIIGPYTLLEQLGEGGMGLVFLAEQRQPVRRQVALKVIKAGMDSRQVIARFEAERQALALMDHPNIAKVLDAGETASGRPYFVMELVKGVPITEYCDRNQVPIRARLELFSHVCQAVQHAHQKGIIHRDIKPSNVLVALHDDKPVVKVIDFGIAKATGAQLTDKPLFTSFAQMVGTPLYMSPEQAGRSGVDVDTRSDIYSLGVLLYELLTGTTPFDKERLEEAGYDELQRIIRDEEPPKPSKRLSTVGQAATTASTRRQSEPRGLSRSLAGELDWVVMKALEKDRNRRYETASALAADVQRYLRDEPVAACPPSAWYRCRKFARRHKIGLVSAALVALAIVAGTGVSLWQAIRATEFAASEQQALLNLGEEQKATERELGRTQDAEKKAMQELFESLVAQSRANRLSRRIGQRFGTLELLRKATGIARQLDLPPERYLEMRNEAIAALALADMRVAKEWPEDPAFLVHFDAKLERYARTDRQGNVQVRRADDGKEICRLPGVGPGENWPALSPDGNYLCVGAAGRVRVWKLAGADPPAMLNLPVLGSAGFSPDSRQLAMQESDGSIGLFDLATGTKERSLPPVPRASCIRFHPAGGRLALACSAYAQVRDLETGKVLWQKNLAAYAYRWAEWHPQGKILAVSDGDAISLWDVEQDKLIGKLEGIQGGGINFAFNPAGTLLANCGWSGVLRLWDPFAGRLLFSTHTGIQTAAPQFSADGRCLAATRHDQKLRIWEIAAADEYRTLIASPLLGKRAYGCVAISPDGRLLAGGAAGGFGLWDLAAGKELAFLEGAAQFNFVAFENRLPRPAVAEKSAGALLTSGTAGLFRRPIHADAGSGIVHIGPAQKLPVPGKNCMIAVSQDGRVLASAQLQGALVLHADQPDLLLRLQPHGDVRHVGVSPDGRWVATARFGYPGGLKIWEVGPSGKSSTQSLTYKLVKDLPTAGLSRPVFSPDGKRLLISAVAGVLPVHRWEVGSWAELPFEEPIEGANAAFSPDGRLMVVETGAGVARLLDSQTGKEYARLEDPSQDCAEHFSFSPDSAKLVSAAGDGHCLHVWDLRAMRNGLADIGLDWECPRYPKAQFPKPIESVIVDTSRALPVTQPPARQEVAKPIPRPSQVAQALANCSKAIELDPRNASRWAARGAAYFNLKQWDQAIADYSKAIELNPKLPNAWHNRGVAYTNLRQWDKALTDFTNAIELNPKVPSGWQLRGNAYLQLKQVDKGLADYSKAIELDPKAANSWQNRGTAYRNLKQWDKALADYTKAIELQSKEPAMWYNRGTLYYYELKQSDEALADYTKAVELNPKFTMAWQTRGNIFSDLKQWDKALADYAKAIELDPKQTLTRLKRAHAYAVLGQWGNAAADLEKAFTPNDLVRWAELAAYRLQAGDTKGYQNACAGMLERFGQTKNPFIAQRVALSCLLIPRPPGEQKLPVQLAELAAAGAVQDHWSRITRGAALYRAGQFEAAVTQLGPILKTWPENPYARPGTDGAPIVTWLFLALANHRLGHTEEARLWLNKAVQTMDRELAEKKIGPLREQSHVWAMCLILRREAEGLLNPPAADRPKKKEP